jgi:hypothetical protein
MGSIAHEDDGGEGVAEQEFTNAGEDEKHATEENIGTAECDVSLAEGGIVCIHGTYTVALFPADPLHPMSSTERGKRATQNPITATGVGLPKVLRRAPAVLFWGERYSFSNCSGDKLRKVFVRWRPRLSIPLSL